MRSNETRNEKVLWRRPSLFTFFYACIVIFLSRFTRPAIILN